MKFPAKILATVFGLGFFPAAPGTLASAAAVAAYVLILHGLPWILSLGLLAALSLLGGLAAGLYARDLGQPDPSRIVIDEVCGQLVALLLLPVAWLPLAISFALFRIFDIIKPFPINRLERLPAGWGIMADDLAAGAAAGLLVHLLILWI
jgi:phosphatidylglycerophosphatase A